MSEGESLRRDVCLAYVYVFLSRKYNGGPGRDRTDDLFHAMEARSQLRHRPTKEGVRIQFSPTGIG